jgi:hypothetical protein
MNELARNAWCSVLLLGLACCGTQHIALASRGTALAGNAKNCGASPADNNCTDTTTDVPADQNQAGTAFIKLPAECGGRIHRIVIHDVSSKSPVAYVECAAKENPISETRPAAGTGR